MLAASALALVSAQTLNNTYSGCLLTAATFNSTSGVSKNYFCSDNKCYNGTRANFTCTNVYTKGELVKRSTTFSHF